MNKYLGKLYLKYETTFGLVFLALLFTIAAQYMLERWEAMIFNSIVITIALMSAYSLSMFAWKSSVVLIENRHE